MNTINEQDKDIPLREDTRLLGRMLGDTVRAHEGDAIFELIERIRQTSIRFHRDEDASARHELEAMLRDLPSSETMQVVRAFSFFYQLSNIAEDLHHIRRTRAHMCAGSKARDGSIEPLQQLRRQQIGQLTRNPGRLGDGTRRINARQQRMQIGR